MQLRHILESQQFDRDWLVEKLFPLADKMREVVKAGGSDVLSGKRMITFFYEPSTRTHLSFVAAMKLLGGEVIYSTEHAGTFSSVAKGESIEDTIKVICGYGVADIIVLRSDQEGMAKRAAEFSSVPIINAGDGMGQHPSQALLDIYTIPKELGHIDGISIAMCGDLAKGRAARSLVYLLAKFPGIKIFFVSPKVVRMRDDIKDYLDRHEVQWTEEYNDLRAVAPLVDVIYQTRTQSERPDPIINRTELLRRYDSIPGFYVVNQEVLDLMRPNAIVMHPLPRNEELSVEVDKDKRAAYFRQAENGLYVRMALLEFLLV